MLGVNANPVVPDGKAPVRAVPLGGDMNRGGSWSAKFQRIANEVLQHLA